MLDQAPTIELPPAARALMTAIHRRRSFGLHEIDTTKTIPKEWIELILEAARWAPTHGLTEPWRFGVFEKESRGALGEAFGEAYRQVTLPEGYQDLNMAAQRDKVWKAPVWISLGVQPVLTASGKLKMPEIEEISAVACAVQNAHLMASSLGLAAKWVSGLTATHQSVAQFVGITPPGRLLGFLYLGFPSGLWTKSKRAPLKEKVHWFEDFSARDSQISERPTKE